MQIMLDYIYHTCVGRWSVVPVNGEGVRTEFTPDDGCEVRI